MFTGNTVQLMEFDGQFGLQVVRDCALSYVAKIPSDLEGRLVPCGHARHVAEAATLSGVAGVITSDEHRTDVPAQMGLAISANPQASAWALHEHLAALAGFQWADFPSRIDPTADIRPGAHVAERNVVIEAATVVMPGAVICERSVIGAHCFIGPSTLIGCQGFEVNTRRSPRGFMRQSGGVWLHDRVEIAGLTSVARAIFGGFTRIDCETTIDCHVYVAHDCRIGQRVRIAAAAELSGRVTVGDDVFIGPNCAISNGLSIGHDAEVSIGAVVVRNVPANEKVTGHFALQHSKWLHREYLRAREA
jgi:UDP-3-O-[3-hydroxymyristoyl] glucosamine N-acyltransferase